MSLSFGIPLGSTPVFGRVTLPTTGNLLAAAGAVVNLRAVWLRADPANAADDLEYGPAGFTAGTGMPLLVADGRVPVLVDDLSKLGVRGTAGVVVCYEGYR